MTDLAPSSRVTFKADELQAWVADVLRRCGLSDDDALSAATVLITADRRGVDSHGVARLASYVGLVRSGTVNAAPRVRIVRERSSTATIDGDNGLGLVVGPQANALALTKAEECGSGFVTVRNSNHFGLAGYYVLQAIERELIGWAMTNGTPVVAPLWGAEARLGTNPIAIGFPSGEEPPIVLDMATSAVAYGKLEMAQRLGVSIPKGWAIDAAGETATDPGAMMKGGALLPLGSSREMGGHKGYGLAVAVDLLSAVLSGANWGPWVPPFSVGFPPPARQVGAGIGHFFGAFQVEAFIDLDEWGRQVDDYIRTMRATEPQPGTNGPVLPGHPERLTELHRAVHGIPLLLMVVAGLEHIAKQLRCPLPTSL